MVPAIANFQAQDHVWLGFMMTAFPAGTALFTANFTTASGF